MCLPIKCLRDKNKKTVVIYDQYVVERLPIYDKMIQDESPEKTYLTIVFPTFPQIYIFAIICNITSIPIYRYRYSNICIYILEPYHTNSVSISRHGYVLQSAAPWSEATPPPVHWPPIGWQASPHSVPPAAEGYKIYKI